LYDQAGRLTFVGKVGTGFTHQTLAELGRQFRPLQRETSPFDQPVPREHASDAHWLDPGLVGDVTYRTLTVPDRRLRHGRGFAPTATPTKSHGPPALTSRYAPRVHTTTGPERNRWLYAPAALGVLPFGRLAHSLAERSSALELSGHLDDASEFFNLALAIRSCPVPRVSIDGWFLRDKALVGQAQEGEGEHSVGDTFAGLVADIVDELRIPPGVFGQQGEDEWIPAMSEHCEEFLQPVEVQAGHGSVPLSRPMSRPV
jgi:hypothetical protein